MDSRIILNTWFPYQNNSDHITNLSGIPILQHGKVGNFSHLPTRFKLKLWGLTKKLSAGNNKVSNLVKIFSLEDRLGKQVAVLSAIMWFTKLDDSFPNCFVVIVFYFILFSVFRVRSVVAASLPSAQWISAKSYLLQNNFTDFKNETWMINI